MLVAALAMLLVAAATSGGALAQRAYEPGRGTAERSELMNAIRPLVEARVGPPVEFVVDRLRVAGDWAFAIVQPQRPGGGAIDMYATVYRDQVDYMDGLGTYVLLRHAHGRWNVVDFAVGPTDVFWDGDPLYLQLPRGLLPGSD
jgi:hypothetical protein